MVKFINRKLSPALALPIVPSQILYPLAPYIFVAHTTAVLQLRRADVCQKGPHVQICSQWIQVRAEMLSGVQSSAYHYCPGVISMRSRL
jgi:hypothetical protein